MAILSVGTGQQYTRIADAVRAAKDGDVVQVQAGTYINDFPVVDTKISIVGVGGMVHLKATVPPPNGKGILLANTDLTVENLEFSGAAVSSLNGCGIRYQGGNLKVQDCYFHDNQMNILGNAVAGGTVTVDDSEFGRTTLSSKLSHSLYMGKIAKLTVTDSYFHDTVTGHHIKSRADVSVIENNRLVDGTGRSSYSIDLPDGGVGLVRGNFIVQGVNGDNPNIIHFGGESAGYPGSKLTVTGNVIVNEKATGTGLANQIAYPAEFTGNQLYKVTTLASGQVATSGNTTLATKPPLDTTTPYDPFDSVPAPVPAPEPAPAPAPAPEPAPVPAPVPAPEPEPTGTVINGTSGNDMLYGTGGEKIMVGGAGNDTYIVDSAGDVVKELSGQGSDTVRSSIGYELVDNVESLVLTGTGATYGGGNGQSNQMTGNGANNAMWGLAGNDTIRGMGGDDVINGGSGRDYLTGGTGADSFVYRTASDGTTLSANGLKGWTRGDTITDFQSGIDTFKVNGTTLNLDAGGKVGDDVLMLTTAYNGSNAVGDDYAAKQAALIVDSTGTLYYDANGADAGYTILATIQSGAKIAAADISVYYDLG